MTIRIVSPDEPLSGIPVPADLPVGDVYMLATAKPDGDLPQLGWSLLQRHHIAGVCLSTWYRTDPPPWPTHANPGSEPK
jgi:hypothetical protein